MATESLLVSTGLPALDQVLGGGLHKRQTTLVCGVPGSGKTVLAAQVACAHAAAGRPVVFATTGGESNAKLIDGLQGFSFFNKEQLGRDLYVVSAQPWVIKGVKELREVLVLSVRERKAKLLVLDGLGALRESWKDERLVRELVNELGAALSQVECAALFTSADSLPAVLSHPEAAGADAVIAPPLGWLTASGCTAPGAGEADRSPWGGGGAFVEHGPLRCADLAAPRVATGAEVDARPG